jgi:inhibitor of KinA sporulation pathway (predicted exonuclease)
MNYIILDLEWDSIYSVKHHRFVNQIIQIGAIKLDDELDIVDTFDVIVKSSIGKKLTKRFVELTGITSEMMAGGISLTDAVLRYNNFVGKNYTMLTWSTSDLYTILENSNYLLPKNIRFKFGKYVDLQSYVQNEMRSLGFEIKSQISLSHAAEMLDISAEGLDLHTAKDDCLLTYALLKRFFDKEKMLPYIKNTDDPEFFKRLTFKAYTLTNIRDDNIKPSDLVFNCDKCKSTAKCVTGWKYRNGWFSANFKCGECKRNFIGRISFKKTYDNLVIKRKIVDLKAVEKKDVKPQVQSVSEKM